MSVQNSAGGPGAWIAPTVIATAMVGLVGTWASVAGELSMRLKAPGAARHDLGGRVSAGP